MLMGIYQNSIDGKNRISVPARFRDELGYKCVLTRGLDDCLVLYPLSTWADQQKRLEALPRSDEKARAFLRYTYANATECEIDKQGRTLIPQFLKDIAHLSKDLVTIGMMDRVEIWARDVYEKDHNGGMLSASDLSEIGEKYQV